MPILFLFPSPPHFYCLKAFWLTFILVQVIMESFNTSLIANWLNQGIGVSTSLPFLHVCSLPAPLWGLYVVNSMLSWNSVASLCGTLEPGFWLCSWYPWISPQLSPQLFPVSSSQYFKFSLTLSLISAWEREYVDSWPVVLMVQSNHPFTFSLWKI